MHLNPVVYQTTHSCSVEGLCYISNCFAACRFLNAEMHAAAGIMAAVWNVTWPISTEYAEDGRYNTLLQISIGQEEVDEVITRDIHRTFPEHPQFGFAQGQQALFRVLKAYSLHDLEVCSYYYFLLASPAKRQGASADKLHVKAAKILPLVGLTRSKQMLSPYFSSVLWWGPNPNGLERRFYNTLDKCAGDILTCHHPESSEGTWEIMLHTHVCLLLFGWRHVIAQHNGSSCKYIAIENSIILLAEARSSCQSGGNARDDMQLPYCQGMASKQ